MRRLPSFLLATLAVIIVLIALLVSGLRLALPHAAQYRPQIVAQLNKFSGFPIEIGDIQANWQSFGPTLEIRDISVHPPKGDVSVQRIILALNVWKSLLQWRWQFKELTFYGIQANSKVPFKHKENDNNSINIDQLQDIFLRQFDHFILHDSHIAFPTEGGVRIQLDIPQLVWFNARARHRAEGEIRVATSEGQRGRAQLRVDLHDRNGLLSDGQVYLQADDIELSAWLKSWVNTQSELDSASFTMASWLNIADGEVQDGLLLLNKGKLSWLSDKAPHLLTLDNAEIKIAKQAQGWSATLPTRNFVMDGIHWPKGSVALMYQPEEKTMLGKDNPGEIRVRAANLQLERISPLLSVFSMLSPEQDNQLKTMQPQGEITRLAADIPLKQPESSRFQVAWQNISWQPWQSSIPGINHFSGSASGTGQDAALHFMLNDSTLPYGDMFQAPLAVKKASGYARFNRDEKEWTLSGQQLDIQANGLWAKGDFSFNQPEQGEPWLSILAGIRVYDAGQAWRYFPVPLMGKQLADYLSGAIQGGRVDNATLVYAGNPHLFPYYHNEGQFQVWVPLQDATFQFQPDWEPLTHLDATLNFMNDGLWITGSSTNLGGAHGFNIRGEIPSYQKEKLFIDADVSGSGKSVHDYFEKTPLKNSVASALEMVQVEGNVDAKLHLDIPLDGKQTRAMGDITLHNNKLFITPINSEMNQVSGKFSFDNGALKSSTLTARWLGQPINVNFSTIPGDKDYRVAVDIHGNWLAAKLPEIPGSVSRELSGNAPWTAKVGINLPSHGSATYQVDVNADLKNVASRLPAPLGKEAHSRLDFNTHVIGDMNGLQLSGHLGPQQYFNGQINLSKQGVALDRFVWRNGVNHVPALPPSGQAEIGLPEIDGEGALAALMPVINSNKKSSKTSGFRYPAQITLETPKLTLAGQGWHQLRAQVQLQGEFVKLNVKGREIDANAQFAGRHHLRANIAYLYYNPVWPAEKNADPASHTSTKVHSNSPYFGSWPAMQLRCQDCWIKGQRLGKVDADLSPNGDQLRLSNGLIDTGNTRVTVSGDWLQQAHRRKTHLKAHIKGDSTSDSANYFGYTIPLRDANYNIHLDLSWLNVPWSPDMKTLNGPVKYALSKGDIESIDTGRAGRLLRFISYDALLRKLRLDFHDLFGKGFYFDSIKDHGEFKNGVYYTDHLRVDGLEADIRMSGSVNFVDQKINIHATIAPEVSATVAVATAFAVNPIVGAGVFIASKLLSPLWSKITPIRYNITGDLEHPTVQAAASQE